MINNLFAVFQQTLIKTHKGKTIVLQHDVSSPRPYTRNYLLSGSKAYAEKRDELKIAVSENPSLYLAADDTKKLMADNEHSFYKTRGDLARKVGAHGGMDFIMDYRPTTNKPTHQRHNTPRTNNRTIPRTHTTHKPIKNQQNTPNNILPHPNHNHLQPTMALPKTKIQHNSILPPPKPRKRHQTNTIKLLLLDTRPPTQTNARNVHNRRTQQTRKNIPIHRNKSTRCRILKQRLKKPIQTILPTIQSKTINTPIHVNHRPTTNKPTHQQHIS